MIAVLEIDRFCELDPIDMVLYIEYRLFSSLTILQYKLDGKYDHILLMKYHNLVWRNPNRLYMKYPYLNLSIRSVSATEKKSYIDAH